MKHSLLPKISLLVVSSLILQLMSPLMVSALGPILSFPSISNPQIISTCPCTPTTNSKIELRYDYANLTINSSITYTIYRNDILGKTKVKTIPPNGSSAGSGFHSTFWDGSVDSGTLQSDTDYYFEVTGTDGNTTFNTLTSGFFTVNAPLAPVVTIYSVSNLRVAYQSQSPYAPNLGSDLLLYFDGTNLNNADLTLEVYKDTYPGPYMLSSKTFSGYNGSSSTFSINWNGKYSVNGLENYYVPDADYVLVLYGKNNDGGQTSLGPVTASLNVKTYQLPVGGQVKVPSISNAKIVNQNSLTPVPGATFSYDYKNLTASASVVATIYRYVVAPQIKDVVRTSINVTPAFVNDSSLHTYTYIWDGKRDDGVTPAPEDDDYYIEFSGHDTSGGNSYVFSPLSVTFKVNSNAVAVLPPASLSNPQVLGGNSYYNYTANPIQFTVDYKNFVSGVLNAHVYLKQGANQTDYASWGGGQFTIQGTGVKTYSWDGLDNAGKPAPDGTYYFEVLGNDNGPVSGVTSSSFTIKNPTLSNVTATPTNYNPSVDGALKIGFDLNNVLNSQKTDVVFLIAKDIGQANQVAIDVGNSMGLSGGHNEISWNGVGTPNGGYNAVVVGVINGIPLNTIAQGISPLFNIVSSVAVPVDPNAPAINALQVTPNPYDPSKGPAVLSYTAVNLLNSTTVDATIYDLNNNVMAQWNALHPVSGANTITWTAATSLQDGLYIFEIKAAGIATAKTIVTVNNTASDLPVGTILCSVFPDNPKIAATSDDCKAIQYFKDKGVFTGTAQGNLDPYGLLQRDQVTKVLLTAFSKYDAAVNYCTGTTMLKDIGQGGWYDNYVCRGTNLTVGGKAMITGYASGADKGYFRPDWKVNRAEFAALVFRLFGTAGSSLQADVKSTDWYADYAKSVKFYNLWSGNFDAQKTLSRLEVIQALYKLHLADGSKI